MFDGLSLEDLFLIVFGVVIFVIGTTSLRNQIRIKRAGNVLEGTVLRTKHVDKKDSDGNLIQNYFEIRVEYLENGHKSQCTIRSVSEYREGEKVLLLRDRVQRNQFTIYEGGNTPVFGPWMVILGGALVAAMPLVQRRWGMMASSVVLVALLLLVGVSMIWKYISDKRRHVTPVHAVIADVPKFEQGQKKKMLKPNASYYPILKYEWKGEERTMRSNYSASTPNSFKVGAEQTLYWDNDRKCIIEKGPRVGILIGGILFLAVALTGIISTLYTM